MPAALILTLFLTTMPLRAALLDQLVAYYGFDEGLSNQFGTAVGTTISGGSPEAGWTGGLVAIGTNSVARSTLLMGPALNLVRDENDQIKVPIGSGPSATAAGTFNLGSSFALSVWHFLAPIDFRLTNRYFVFEAEDNFDLSWGTSASNRFLSYIGGTGGPSALVETHRWYHVVYSVETTDTQSRLSLYLNGVQIGTASTAATNVDFDRIVFGNARDAATPARRFDGLLDELMLWNRPVTSDEVVRVYQLGLNGARFAARLDVSATPADAADVSVAEWHEHGSTATVTVATHAGFIFAGWAEAEWVGQPVTLDAIMTNDRVATARFEPDLSDPDGDGLSTFDELNLHGTSSVLADTDGDGLNDALEIASLRTDPLGSDAARIAALQQQFDAAQAARIRLSDIRIALQDGSPTLLTSLEAASSTSAWSRVDLNMSTLTTRNGRVRVSIPNPVAGANTYRLETNMP